MLENQGYLYDVLDASSFSSTSGDYSAIMLIDVSGSGLSPAALDAMAGFADRGSGIVWIAGNLSGRMTALLGVAPGQASLDSTAAIVYGGSETGAYNESLYQVSPAGAKTLG